MGVRLGVGLMLHRLCGWGSRCIGCGWGSRCIGCGWGALVVGGAHVGRAQAGGGAHVVGGVRSFHV